MDVKSYDSLGDLKKDANEQSNDTYFRDEDPTESTSAEGAEAVTGTLQVGDKESLLLYFGEESGDYAAWCFENDSDAGRAILAAGEAGQKFEVTGKIDYEAGCFVPGLEADLSASGRIESVESVSVLAE
jgi:hypothetical protein